MRVVATGRVHPERADVRFTPVTWLREGGDRITVCCDASQIAVVADFQARIDYVTALITVKQVVDAVVSALALALGTGYWVELIQLLEEDGSAHVFGVRPGNLSFEPSDPVFHAAAELSKKDIFFRFALRDYAAAMRETLDCAFFCYRAIEAIEGSFAAATGQDGWSIMHATLGTTRDRIEQVVKVFADPVRHGNWFSLRPTTSGQRNEMLQVTREVLARYLDHKRDAAQQLR
jgi:hypothetical protein